MTNNSNETLSTAQSSLQRIQQFDPSELEQRDRLGADLHFGDAIGPAKKLIDLYRKLSSSALEDFPIDQLTKIKELANGDYAIFTSILSFDGKTQKGAERDAIIQRLINRYDALFNELYPLVSYSMHKAVDFEGLEARARALFQEFKDKAGEQIADINEIKNDADLVLENVRDIAAEMGVTQQASYFDKEADSHNKQANYWYKLTLYSGSFVLLYTIALFVMSFLSLPNITDKYQAFQYATSKFIVFFVLSFGLYFTVKNYFSHKHNAILNQHRKNALLTYKAITDAANESANTDIILNQAAACIFSPQETGFSSTKTSSTTQSSTPINYLLKHASGE